MLNPNSPIPLYYQLAEILLAKIRSKEYTAGAKIPSENELAKMYGIGRPTARQATDLLVRRRFLVRKRGAGTFVLKEHEEVDLFSLAGTLSSFQKKGIRPDVRIIAPITKTMTGSDPENPFSGREAFFFSRISTVDGTPVLLEDMYLDADLFSGIDKLNFKTHSISELVKERYYMTPSDGRQTFQIGYMTKSKADFLSITAKTPILIVKRSLNFDAAPNAIYTELFCRTDRFVFSQKIGGFNR